MERRGGVKVQVEVVGAVVVVVVSGNGEQVKANR
jgi:hypothetical protein